MLPLKHFPPLVQTELEKSATFCCLMFAYALLEHQKRVTSLEVIVCLHIIKEKIVLKTKLER